MDLLAYHFPPVLLDHGHRFISNLCVLRMNDMKPGAYRACDSEGVIYDAYFNGSLWLINGKIEKYPPEYIHDSTLNKWIKYERTHFTGD